MSFGCLGQFEPDLNNNPAFLGISYINNTQFESGLINMGFKKKVIKDPSKPNAPIVYLENKKLGYEVHYINSNCRTIALTNLSTIFLSDASANVNKVVNRLVELYGEPDDIKVELVDVTRTSSGIILSEESVKSIVYYWLVNDKLMFCAFRKIDNEYSITILISSK